MQTAFIPPVLGPFWWGFNILGHLGGFFISKYGPFWAPLVVFFEKKWAILDHFGDFWELWGISGDFGGFETFRAVFVSFWAL
jgi:hypothetical protein